MKTVNAYDVIMAILETKDHVTFYDINMYREAHYKTHPDEYLEIDRNSVLSAVDCAPEVLYWVCDARHDNDRIIRQEVFVCPCCGNKILKYPDVERYDKLVASTHKLREYLVSRLKWLHGAHDEYLKSGGIREGYRPEMDELTRLVKHSGIEISKNEYES